MYTGFLHSHNLFRYLILILALIVLIRSYRGWLKNKKFKKADNILSVILISFLDIQILIGLVLYIFLSPVTKIAFENLDDVLMNNELRFYTIDHIVLMITAVVFAHIGRAKIKKSAGDKLMHKNTAVYFSTALAIILLAIPWQRAWF